jgi:hypothetical protein
LLFVGNGDLEFPRRVTPAPVLATEPQLGVLHRWLDCWRGVFATAIMNSRESLLLQTRER